MDRSIMMDINKIGPGIWFKIHMDAVSANTQELKESFIININALCDGFKCKHCQPHFRKYIDDNPIEKYFDIKNKKGNHIGIFQWTWEFHNAVNYRLGKYQPLLEEAYNYYTNNTVGACHSCGQNKDIDIKTDTERSKIITTYDNADNKIINIKSDNPGNIVKYKDSSNQLPKTKIVTDNDSSVRFKPHTFKSTQIPNNKDFPFKIYTK